MGKVIVGFDEREVSADALALGIRLASACGDELVVAAAYGFEQQNLHLEGNYFERRKLYFERTFRLAAEQVGSTPFTAEPIDDLPARGLHYLAEKLEARAIVVGSTTRGRLGRTLIGSTGESLFNSAPCAVAVAPRGYARSQHPSLGLIGVGFDGRESSLVALREAAAIAERTDSDLEVISARPIHRLPLPGAAPEELRLEELHERAERELGTAGRKRARFVDEAGDPAGVLARRGVELDLLVVGSRGFGPLRRTVLGSTGAELVKTAPCPVVVVPRAAGHEEPGGERNDVEDTQHHGVGAR